MGDKVIVIITLVVFFIGSVFSVLSYIAIIYWLFTPQEAEAVGDTGIIRITAVIPPQPKLLKIQGQNIKIVSQFHNSKWEDRYSHGGKVLTRIYIAE